MIGRRRRPASAIVRSDGLLRQSAIKVLRKGLVVVHAPAKVNLDLRVFAPRPDGYHELRTVYQALALHDTLTCMPRRGPFTIRCRTPGVPRDARNLVWRAAAALWEALGRSGPPRDVVITIEKQIPVQAGLAGGSTDAAAALRALDRVWGGAPSVRLEDLAAHLGADVPFFFAGGTAVGVGRGDEIRPLDDLPQYWVVLVCPRFGVSTGDAYRWCDADRASGLEQPGPTQHLPGMAPGAAVEMRNDLEAPVIRRHPEIAGWKARLADTGAEVAAMSGSGSAVFGLFRSRARAGAALRTLTAGRTRVLMTRTVSARQYARLAAPVAKKR